MALHIASSIKDNALVALVDLGRIQAQAGRLPAREWTTLVAQADRTEVGFGSAIDRSAKAQRNHVAVILTAATYQLREAATLI